MSEASTLTNNPSFREASDVEGEAVGEAAGGATGGATGETTGENEAARADSGPATSRVSGFCGAALAGAKRNPILCLSLLAIPTVAVPAALVAGEDTPFDTFLLVFLWTGTLAAQSSIECAGCLRPFRRRRSLLATLLNAVLWTSLGMIAYVVAKSAVKRTSVEAVLDDFATGTTLADVMRARPAAGLGAGDVAVSVLDAGIVSWGLRLFECRRQLLSVAGLATLLVGTAAALGNVVCGPLLVGAMGLRPAARCLAFAARSVTLALAGPAMARLDGDVGLNAAMVVLNGILFQMGMGAGVASAVVRIWNRLRRGRAGPEAGRDVEKNRPRDRPRERPRIPARRVTRGEGTAEDASEANRPECRTVAVGVAVGINAAAMGAAYLYETGDRAAPYAAVSMTAFGVMTVVFTTIRPLAAWLVARVS